MATTVVEMLASDRYRVVFDRIGRTHGSADNPFGFEVDVLNADALAERAYYFARPHLRSRDVEVVVDLSEMSITIFCGAQVGGRGRIEPLRLTVPIAPTEGA
jgi:hypothetical protein